MLPPHFTGAGMERLRKIGIETFVECYGHHEMPDCFRRVLYFLLASIVYHVEFLRETLSEGHPLWNQRLFTRPVTVDGVTYSSACTSLSGMVVTGLDRCEETGLQATEIPTHLIVANAVSALNDQFSAEMEEARRERAEIKAGILQL